jgi:hypothetical protein
LLKVKKILFSSFQPLEAVFSAFFFPSQPSTLEDLLLACNPSSWESEIRKIQAQGQPRQVARETPSPK